MSSKIFEGFKALGLHSSHIGHVKRYHGRHKEFYIIVAIGKFFHTYNLKLGICQVSNSHDKDIECIATDAFYVYTGVGNTVRGFQHNKQVKFVYNGHEHPVHLILPFGKHLITVDQTSNVRIWHIESKEQYLELQFDNDQFQITTLCHPSTYINKVLFASAQGRLQLWNISKNKLIFEFMQCQGNSVLVLEQSPAIDVVAAGCDSGKIVLIQLKKNSVIMKLQQEYGPVTSIAFHTEGSLMCSGTVLGHICLWNLNEKRLVGLIKNAHYASIAALSFLAGKSILVSNAADNALKLWTIDKEDGDFTLLRGKVGHHAPPNKLKFFENELVISAGLDSTIRQFSTVDSRKDKNMGQASLNRKQAKKKANVLDCNKLPPVVDFCLELSRNGQWDNLIAYHHRHELATTWDIQRSKMGSHQILHERFYSNRVNQMKEKRTKTHYVSSVAMTSCGNFCLTGHNTGHVDLHNIQSGIWRGAYIDKDLDSEIAHSRRVTGIVVDGLNQVVATCGSEGLLKFWKFKEKSLLRTLTLDSAPAGLNLHRGSGMLAVILDDFSLLVADIETFKIVRKFSGHESRVNDVSWSENARWLVTAGNDCLVKTWDLPPSCMVDCFMVDNAVTSLALSPNGDLMATSHVDDLGVYLWTNQTLYRHVALRPLPLDFQPMEISELPKTRDGAVDADSVEEVEEEIIVERAKEVEQIEKDLITFSRLPISRWANLLELDQIRKRNKPKEPPKVPKNVPFFLPTLSALTPELIVEDKAENVDQSKMITADFGDLLTPLGTELTNFIDDEENYVKILELLKEMGPSKLDSEIRSLAPDGGGSLALLEAFISFSCRVMKEKRDFEFVQACFGLFLKQHTEVLASLKSIEESLSEVMALQEENRQDITFLVDQSLCITNFIRSVTL